jgi:hypothetical protein
LRYSQHPWIVSCCRSELPLQVWNVCCELPIRWFAWLPL